eukprot:887615_1
MSQGIQTHQNYVIIEKDISKGFGGYADYTITASYRLVSNDGDSGRLICKEKVYGGFHYKDTLRFHVRINYGRAFQISKQNCRIVRGNEPTPDSDDGIDTTGIEHIFVTFGANDPLKSY